MGVKGRLADMGLVDIVQVFVAERKTVAVHLNSEMGFGHVYIKDGRVVHAAYRDKDGVNALRELLGWKDGEFEVEPDIESPRVTIEEPTESLLFEGVMGLDERGTKTAEVAKPAADMESARLINRLLELGILEKI
ncbi:MAG TPA: DUF4388 domain-containing protein [Thermodesulfobacteriota bacterium]|nr:DUF4388 domain-containing protein [Thermodesulfobacteriota bacterium]